MIASTPAANFAFVDDFFLDEVMLFFMATVLPCNFSEFWHSELAKQAVYAMRLQRRQDTLFHFSAFRKLKLRKKLERRQIADGRRQRILPTAICNLLSAASLPIPPIFPHSRNTYNGTARYDCYY